MMQEIIAAPSMLGSATGYDVALNNAGWVRLTSGFIQVVTTAANGERAITAVLKDSSDRPLWRANATPTQEPGILLGYCLGSGVEPGQQHNIIYLPLPTDMWLPPNSIVRILDLNNVDSKDQITIANFVLT